MDRSRVQPLLRPVFGRVYIAQNVNTSVGNGYRCLRIPTNIQYYSFCDDFGPMNMACIFRFIDCLDNELESYPSIKIIFAAEKGRRALANTAFLLGSYLLIKMQYAVENVKQEFAWLNSSLVEAYRDATFYPTDFYISLGDCWAAIAKAQSMGWLSLENAKVEEADRPRSSFYLADYEHYDNPLNGDLHVVVPGKFAAFKGPVQLPPRRLFVDGRAGREFSPAYFAVVFQHLGISDVVRNYCC